MSDFRKLKKCWVASIAFFLGGAVFAEGPMWRFEFDNDIVGGSDDFFSAGWSIQRHSAAVSSWEEMELSSFSQWISKHVPGLSGGEDMFVRRGTGLSQIIQTPKDISDPALIEDDVPYAGVLGIASSWTALSNERIVTFQLYTGVLGPASLAEQAQKFVHNDLGLGDDPMGWDHQLSNEFLLNLNMSAAHKLWSSGQPAGMSMDLAGGGGFGLGNLFTQVQLGLQTRFGWNMPAGFAHIPDLAGRGVIVNPVLDAGEPGVTRLFGTITARTAAVGYTVLLDGNTFEDSHRVSYDPYLTQVITGLHWMQGAMGLHFNLYLSTNPADDFAASELSWGNVSFSYQFD
jgi:lipid A 3-O-deacylase